MKTLFLSFIIIASTYATIDENTLNSLQTSEHWNTFRIVLSHISDECFYLETKLNDTIHVIYQVLKGGDSNIRTRIVDPLGHVVFTRPGNPFGWYNDKQNKVSGTYEICFNNEQYFTAKIIYIGVLAAHHDRLMESALKSIKEKVYNETAHIEEFSINARKLFSSISRTIFQVTAYQVIRRVQDIHDLYLVESNANYVQKWALFQIGTMLICSILQVFSIRQLFKPHKTTATPKKSNQNFHLQTTDRIIICN